MTIMLLWGKGRPYWMANEGVLFQLEGKHGKCLPKDGDCEDEWSPLLSRWGKHGALGLRAGCDHWKGIYHSWKPCDAEFQKTREACVAEHQCVWKEEEEEQCRLLDLYNPNEREICRCDPRCSKDDDR